MEEKIIKPIIPNVDAEYFLMLKTAILKTNNLKIGDVIIWNFRYDTLRGAYKSRQMNRYNAYEESEGVLKEDENGFLVVESIKEYPFHNLTSNGLIGRSRKEWYKREMRKAVHRFGEGFKSASMLKSRTNKRG